MARAPREQGITIGFMGTGEMEVNAATTLLEEFINNSVKPDEPARFVFPLTADEFTDSMAGLATMAKASKIAYEVVTNQQEKARRGHTEVASGAAKTYHVPDVFTQIEAILADAPKAALMVLMDPKRKDELDESIHKFVDAGIKVYNLTNALNELGEDEAEALEPEAAEPEEAEVSEDEDEDEVSEEDEDEVDDEDGNAEDAVEIVGVTTSDALWTRPAMEKMSHSEVKDIAISLGLPVRKARENMIVAILEKQGGPQAASEGPVEPVAVAAAAVGTQIPVNGLRELLDDFGNRFFTGLDEWTTRFLGGLEGIQFNLTPEKPMEVDEPETEEEPPRRRPLVRR